MDRRQFLQLSAAAFAAAAGAGCSNPSPRYELPRQEVSFGERLLIGNARIVDVEKGELKSSGRILIEAGRIVALPGDAESVGAVKSLDLGGAYVVPGLINAHCHMTLPCGMSLNPAIVAAYTRQVERNAEECVKNGVTCVRDMMAISLLLKDLKEKIADGRVVGPRIHTSCEIYCKSGYGDKMVFWGNDPFIHRADTPSQAREAVRKGSDRGADFIKIFQQPVELVLPSRPLPVMDTATVSAICDEASRLGKKVAMHQTEHSGFNRGIDGGAHSLEHVMRDKDITEEEIKRFEGSGAVSVPTLSAPFGLANEKPGDPYWGKGSLPWLVKFRQKVLPRMMRQYMEPEWAKSSLAFFKKYSIPKLNDSRHLLPWPDPRHFTSALVLGGENAKKLYEAGITFGCGNDGGIPFVFPGAMDLELLLLARIGVRAKDALKMATINNARVLGLESELGSIEEGKVADLAIYRRNPLDSVLNVSRPEMVFCRGKLAFRRSSMV